MGHIKFVGAMVLTALFAIALVSYLVGFAADNNAVVDITNEDEISDFKSSSETSVISFKDNITSSASAFDESEINPDEETTRTGGQWKGSTKGVFDAITNIISLGNLYIFGDEEGNSGFGIVTTALISFLTFVGIAYMYKTWVGKNPD